MLVVLVVDELAWGALNLQGIHSSAKPEETTQSWQSVGYTKTLKGSNRHGNSPGLCCLPSLQTQEGCWSCWGEASGAF